MGRRTLLVVESPAKARTIQKIVGKEYTVASCAGHLKDLPEHRLGVDIKHGFTPTYITIKGKEKILERLKEYAKNAAKVLLALDPDREGEAIAYHIAKEFEGMGVLAKRVSFFQITPGAIKEALKEPKEIDMNKVWAQQARRVLDRLVGYKLSPLLWEKIKGRLSAGRVQSVALLLICEREEEIRKFTPKVFWRIKALLKKEEEIIEARLYKIKGKLFLGSEEKEAEEIASYLRRCSFAKVEKVLEKQYIIPPPPPFITSTLQQEAAKKLLFSVERTMRIAQQLYEGLKVKNRYTGLITYMRTDSPRIAEEFKKSARTYIKERYGAEFLPPHPPTYKASKTAQEAHEAIRPTSLHLCPENVKDSLNNEQFKLYELIWKRFLASQMCGKKMLSVIYWIKADDFLLFAKGEEVVHPGFSILWEDDEEISSAPKIKEGDVLEIKEVECKKCQTFPPPRYTEATLVKMLEKNGIGRPSTYAPIISTIFKRGYARKEKGKIYPTELGETITRILKRNFPNLLNVDFTARLEEELDEIEEGRKEWRKLLEEFWSFFKEELKRARMQIPDLRHTPSGKICKECGAPLYQKYGRFGRFLLCSRWPECKWTEPLSVQIKCRKCEGELLLRYTKKGKSFYACSNAPKCSYILWDEPVGECLLCGDLKIKNKNRIICVGCGRVDGEGA